MQASHDGNYTVVVSNGYGMVTSAVAVLTVNNTGNGPDSATVVLPSTELSVAAAVQAVADARGVPFLGIRGISDGAGDPLHLPGFPFQFFFYHRVAAQNAARVTAALLRNPTGG